MQLISPMAELNDTKANASSSVPVCDRPDVVYGTVKSTDEAADLSVMDAVSVVSTSADCSTISLPSACTETVAEPFGVPTELH